MFLCPNCDRPLSRANVQMGVAWPCGKCHGRAMTLPVLRRLVEGQVVQRLWNRTLDETLPRKHACPACEQPMVQVPLDAPDGGFALDVCRRCTLVWFDPHEFEAMPARSLPPPEPELPLAVRQRLAIAEIEERARVAREKAPAPADARLLPTLLGMPVELHGAERTSIAWGTWITAALVAVTSILAFGDRGLIERFALVPDQMWRLGGLTMLTAFFLHGGWLHLIGNLYFFVVFGDNVEGFLGRGRWLLLLAGATLAGSLLHALGDPGSTVPCVGASGGTPG